MESPTHKRRSKKGNAISDSDCIEFGRQILITQIRGDGEENVAFKQLLLMVMREVMSDFKYLLTASSQISFRLVRVEPPKLDASASSVLTDRSSIHSRPKPEEAEPTTTVHAVRP